MQSGGARVRHISLACHSSNWDQDRILGQISGLSFVLVYIFHPTSAGGQTVALLKNENCLFGAICDPPALLPKSCVRFRAASGGVVFFIVRVECERLVPVQKFADWDPAERVFASLTTTEPTRYLLLDYDPQAFGLSDPVGEPFPAEPPLRTSARPNGGPRPCHADVRALLLKLEHASLSCRVARTTRTSGARMRSIRSAREALEDAKLMAIRVSMSDGERLWFQTTAAAVSSQILSEIFRGGQLQPRNDTDQQDLGGR